MLCLSGYECLQLVYEGDLGSRQLASQWRIETLGPHTAAAWKHIALFRAFGDLDHLVRSKQIRQYVIYSPWAGHLAWTTLVLGAVQVCLQLCGFTRVLDNT